MAKQVFSSRIDEKNLETLKSLAKEKGHTVSALIDTAIDEFLQRQSLVGNALILEQPTDFCISSDDIKHVAPVVEAFGKEIPLKLFVQIIESQR
jgi:hypothetical protein